MKYDFVDLTVSTHFIEIPDKFGSTTNIVAKTQGNFAQLRIEPESGKRHEKIDILVHADVQPVVFGRHERTLIDLQADQTDLTGIWRITTDNADSIAEIVITSNDNGNVSIVQSMDSPPQSLVDWIETRKPTSELNSVLRVILIFTATLIVLNLIVRSQTINNIDKNVAVLLTAFGAVTTFFGLRLTPEKVWSVVGSIAKRVGNEGLIVLTVYAAVVAAYHLRDPISCLYHSYRYERHIAQSLRAGELDDRKDHALKALEIFPQRSEAYLVLSKLIGGYRASNRNRQTVIADMLLKEPAVNDRVVEFINGDVDCGCLSFATGEKQYNRNQAISLMFMLEDTAKGYRDGVDMEDDIALPEHAKFETQLNDQARQLSFYRLRKIIWTLDRTDYRAVLDVHKHAENRSRVILDQRIYSIDPVKFSDLHSLLDKLETLLYGDGKSWEEKGSISHEFPDDFIVQLALDRLFRHRLLTCQFQEARRQLAELIHMRQELLGSHRPWLFSSDTLEVFQFIRTIRSTRASLGSHVYLPAYNRLKNYAECDNWPHKDDRKESSDDGTVHSERQLMRRQLKDDFPKWFASDEIEWKKNTVDGLSWQQLREIVEREGRSNWSY